MIYVKITLT